MRNRSLIDDELDRPCRGLKPTRVILLCAWERHFAALFSAWCSWQAALHFSDIFNKI